MTKKVEDAGYSMVPEAEESFAGAFDLKKNFDGTLD